MHSKLKEEYQRLEASQKIEYERMQHKLKSKDQQHETERREFTDKVTEYRSQLTRLKVSDEEEKIDIAKDVIESLKKDIDEKQGVEELAKQKKVSFRDDR